MEGDPLGDNCVSQNMLSDYRVLEEIVRLAQNGEFDSSRLETFLLQGLEFFRLSNSVAVLTDRHRALLVPLLLRYGFYVGSDQELDELKISNPLLRALALRQEERIEELLASSFASLRQEEQIQAFYVAAGQGLRAVVKRMFLLLSASLDTDAIYKVLEEGMIRAVVAGNRGSVEEIFTSLREFSINRISQTPANLVIRELTRRSHVCFQALRFAVMQGNVEIVQYLLSTGCIHLLPDELKALAESLEKSMIAYAFQGNALWSDSLNRKYAEIKLLLRPDPNELFVSAMRGAGSVCSIM